MSEEFRIEVEHEAADHITGTKNGRDYSFHVQQVLLFTPDSKHPDKARVTLPRNREGAPYKPGEYMLEPRPYADRNGRLAMGFNLIPTF